MLLRTAAIVAMLAGCPANPSECKLPAGAELEAQLVAADANGMMQPVSDGAHVSLMGAPQGGHILLVGARIHNDDTCQLDATASLRDIASNRVLGVDERTMYLSKTGDGWSQPDASLSAVPNVAVCPTSATAASVNNHPYELEIVIVDGDGKQVADVKASVIPTCATGDDYCVEECAGTGSGA